MLLNFVTYAVCRGGKRLQSFTPNKICSDFFFEALQQLFLLKQAGGRVEMAKMLRNDLTYWLFADNLKPEGCVMQYNDFKGEYDTKKGKKVPVLVLLGSDKDRSGEFLLSTWNISNFNDLLKELGDDSDKWPKDRFFRAEKEGDKIKLVLLPKEERVR